MKSIKKENNKDIKKTFSEMIEETLKKIEEKQKMQEQIFNNTEEILVRKVSKVGNSGRIAVPSKHIGKDAQVIILKRKEEKKQDS